jgi:hypothetical protein
MTETRAMQLLALNVSNILEFRELCKLASAKLEISSKGETKKRPYRTSSLKTCRTVSR